MSGALLRNVAYDAARVLLRRNSPANSFGRVDSVTRGFGVLHSRAHFRSPQFLGKPKFVGASGFCSSSSSSSSSSSTASTGSLVKVGFVGWYLGMVKSHPILTKSITSSLIYVTADLTSQTISRTSSESYDLTRTARMAGYGLLVLGPSLHHWFNLMSRFFPKRDLITTFKKMALGQTIYGPSMAVIFFSLNAGLQGESTSEIHARLKRDLLPTLLSGVMYWPMCDFITFRFSPVHLQPLVSNSFSFLWTIYMTYMASREKASLVLS